MNGVNSVGRQDFVVWIDVGRWEAEFVAAVVAVFDGAEDGEVPAEHGGGLVKVAGQDVLADGRGTDHLAVRGEDGFDFFDGEAVPGGELFHEGDVAGPTVAEMKTGADTDLPAGGDLFDEFFGGRFGEGFVEVDEEAGVEAELPEEGEFMFGGGEQERGLVRPQDAPRMGIEGERDGGSTGRTSFADDTLVAEVDAVEHADG
ncbi:MAG: hypothetical protein PCFJNLEI_04001 [Verrucomicrobiae bacterium]|nr:hypothetical protein [Verrucomicrobiae bacterium]